MDTDILKMQDREVFEAIALETGRQMETLELIASENFTSRAVMQACGSVMTNKYAEGYPGKRYYGGCEFVDIAENLARDRAKKTFRLRVCQCSAALRFKRKHGGAFFCAQTR